MAVASVHKDCSESSTSVPLDVLYTDPDTTKGLWEEVASVATMSNRGHGQGAVAVGMEKDGLRLWQNQPLSICSSHPV